MERTFNDMMISACIRPTSLVDFYSASTMKQLPMGRQVAPLGHIILILSQPGFTLTP
jgi:hypothetical protein